MLKAELQLIKTVVDEVCPEKREQFISLFMKGLTSIKQDELKEVYAKLTYKV